jgi:glycosyltransferase involved in cell wall biosynthesis
MRPDVVDRPLRIGVDARELLGSATGVGRYLGELLRRWTARPDAARRRFLLYVPEPLRMTFPERTVDARVGGRGRGTLWEQTWLRRAIARDAPDVFFAPAYTAPLALPVPFAVTIHDISFVAHPEWFRPVEGARRRFVTARTARAATVVLTVSEFSRSEIQHRLGIDPARIVVIPEGAGMPAGMDGRPRGPRDPLVLYVGSIFNRRRLPDLLRAFAEATRDLPAARLAVVGANRTWPHQDLAEAARSLGIAARVELLDFVSDERLADLYGRASVFTFLSEYEGFGLTPLEAMAAGVPPLVLDTPVAREVYGDAALFVPADAPDRAAASLRSLLTDDALRARLLARAPAVLARYSWTAAADRTLDALEALRR